MQISLIIKIKHQQLIYPLYCIKKPQQHNHYLSGRQHSDTCHCWCGYFYSTQAQVNIWECRFDIHPVMWKSHFVLNTIN